ncbi:MAG: hypothetical protein IPJ85_04000 [Flavobacteriales bacterium]|nr:hypothetical protein [Flavobacteriales bacterium]
MRTIRIQLAALFLFIVAEGLAQLAPLTLNDAVLKAGSTLAPERIRGLQWVEGAANYSYVKGESLLKGSLGKSVDMPVAELATLNKQLPDSAQLKAWPMVQWIDAARFRFFAQPAPLRVRHGNWRNEGHHASRR